MAKFRTRKRYRLMFSNENTFNDVWTLRLSRARVWALGALCVAAIGALVLVVVVLTPLSVLLPGYMEPGQRREAIGNVARLDSLAARVGDQQRYVENITAILSGEPVAARDSAGELTGVADTLLDASANERLFVDSWAERERNSLSVLAPVVAEGMLFQAPGAGAVRADDGSGYRLGRGATVCAVNEGTVVGAWLDAGAGRYVVAVQHANDFVSVVSGLRSLLVEPGAKVESGRALGLADDSGNVGLAVWHQGRRVRLDAIMPQ